MKYAIKDIVHRFPFNLWVLAGLILLSVVLGILNNFRVYEEQRVPWFGPAAEEETEADADLAETDGEAN